MSIREQSSRLYWSGNKRSSQGPAPQGAYVPISLLVIVALMAIATSSITFAGIPLYAELWDGQVVNDITGTINDPLSLRLVDEHGVMIAVGQPMAGLPGYLSSLDNERTHYIGFCNLYYTGYENYVDPDQTIRTNEANFYHSTDPSTLTGWRTASGVELRWTPDLREATAEDFSKLADGSHDAWPDYYILKRVDTASQDSVLFYEATTSFSDMTALADRTYAYSLRTVSVTGQVRKYSSGNILVVPGISAGPHFWVSKVDYNERAYGSPATVTSWPIRFFSSGPVIPDSVTIEVYTELYDNVDVHATYTVNNGVSYDANTGLVALDLPINGANLIERGGIAYRLGYTADGYTAYSPAAVGGQVHLIWSTINNRIMGRKWAAYLMCVESDVWRDNIAAMASRLASGVTPWTGGPTVQYDSIFLDQVLGFRAINWIRPLEYVNWDYYRYKTEELIKYLCANTAMGYYANSTDPVLLEALSNTPGFLGSMNEGMVLYDEGTKLIADALWVARKFPAHRTLFRNISPYDTEAGIVHREQALVGYLLLRDSIVTPGAERILMGYGKFHDPSPNEPEFKTFNIMPEQMIQAGNEIGDVFGAITWPSASVWQDTAATEELVLDWFASLDGANPIRTSNGRRFLVREFELEDGLPEIDNSIFVAWDMEPTGTPPGSFRISDLFPEKASAGEYYRLQLTSGVPPLLVQGAAFGTAATPVDSSLVTVPRDAAVFFSAPISSPQVVPTAVDTIPGNPKYISTLRVLANHWNRKPLYIEVDCTALNGNSAVQLYCASHDSSTGVGSYRATITNVLAGDGTLSLPFRATGTDGLMLLGNIDVIVDSGHTQTFKDYSDSSMVSVLESAITSKPLSIMPVNADGGAVMDLLISEEGATGKYFDAVDEARFVPRFTDHTLNRFVSQSDRVKAGASSCAAADFDGDGNEDFFACSEDTFRLYRLSEAAGNKYMDDTAASIAALPDTSFAAAWYDYNRDGYVDLAIAGRDSAGDGIYFYRNEQGVLQFVQKEPLDLGSGIRSFSAPYPIVWADLDLSDGGVLELIVRADIEGVPTLQAYARADTFSKTLQRYEIEEASSDVFPGGAPTWVTQAVLADLDADGDQDLVVARAGVGATGDKLMVYRNNGGQLVSVAAFPGVTLTDDLSSVLIADMDPDGKPDIIAVPAGQSAPRLFLNASATDIVFEEEATTLSTGSAAGGLAYDWLGGKPNLYLAKTPTGGEVENFFYGYEPAAGVSLGKSVRVRVGATDEMNTSGIGTRIEVEWDGKHAYQWYNGGTGRGGQQPRELVFSLGQVVDQMIGVRAMWPDGVVTELWQHKEASDLFLVEREEPATIDESSVVATIWLAPDGNNWYRFEWDADRQASPEVWFQFADERPECRCGVIESELDLIPGATQYVGATCTQTDDGDFHYLLIWSGRCCEGTRCVFRYRVRCRLNGIVTESEMGEFISPRYCPSN